MSKGIVFQPVGTQTATPAATTGAESVHPRAVDLELSPVHPERNSRFRLVASIAVGCVALLFAVDGIELLWNQDLPSPWARALSVRTQHGIPAIISSIVAIAAGLLAVAIARRIWRDEQRLGVSTAWALTGYVLVAGGIGDLTHFQDHVNWSHAPGGLRFWPVIVLITSIVTVTCYLWRAKAARWLWLAGIALLLTNPVTEDWKRDLTSDPFNYHFVAADVPWQFSESAWSDLRLIAYFQESSEAAAVLLLLCAFIGIVKRDQSNSARDAGSTDTAASTVD